MQFFFKKINYYCCLKTFLKLISPIVTFIYNDTVVHVQIWLQARNTELINLVLGVITNTEAPIHWNVVDSHWSLGDWGYPELAQNDEVISQIFWLSWGHVCLDTSVLSYLKSQVLNLHLYENKLLNKDTSVCSERHLHLKLILKLMSLFLLFSLSFYICWFINVFIIFCRFVFNLRDKDYWLFYKILSLFHFFNTNLNDIYFCGKL